MNTITVACRKSDPAAFGVQKYSNDSDWNISGGVAPNGVSATRYLRRTSPDLEKLSPLAAFLVQHAPSCVAGNFPHFNHAERIRCYNGRTEADQLRAEAATGTCNNIRFSDPAKALVYAENLIRCYALENQAARIDDWHFDIIEPGQSDEEFWNKTAARMIAAGTVRVQIGTAEFTI